MKPTSTFLPSILAVFFLVSTTALAAPAPAVGPTQSGMQSFLNTLQPDGLKDLSLTLAEKSPEESLQLLRQIHAAEGQDTFIAIVKIMCKEPTFLKRFVDAATHATDLQAFRKINAYLANYPEVIRTNTLNAIAGLSDDELVQINKISAQHPEALKHFAMLQDDQVLAAFAKKTFEDQKTMTMIVRNMQKNPDKIGHLADGLDLNDVATKILAQLDKSYYRKLLVPENGDQDLLILGLSLTDGIIDPKGHEKIVISGVDAQARKMIDSPRLILSFIWNIYFGDRSSQVALSFRKELVKADAADGTKDGVVDLRPLVQHNPAAFAALKQNWGAMIDVARFREQMTDPQLLVEPTVVFLKKYDAETVAQTLAPLYIRSLEIEPKLAKIVLSAIPPKVLGQMLTQMTDFMAETPEGKEVLRKMTVSLWQDLKPEDLKKHILLLNDKEPQALFDIVMPVMYALGPQALARTTLGFAQYPQVFYGYNEVALAAFSKSATVPIAKAVVEDGPQFHRIALEVVNTLPEAQLQGFLDRLAKNPAALQSIHAMTQALPAEFKKNMTARFKKNPAGLKTMSKNLPAPIVDQVVKGVGIVQL